MEHGTSKIRRLLNCEWNLNYECKPSVDQVFEEIIRINNYNSYKETIYKEYLGY